MEQLGDQAQDSNFYFVEREESERIQSTLIGLTRDRIPVKRHFDPIGEVHVLYREDDGTPVTLLLWADPTNHRIGQR